MQRALLSGSIRRRGVRAIQDHRSAAALEIEPALLGQQPISLGDGIEMNTEIHRQLPHRGKEVSRLQSSFDKMVPNRIDNLPVDRDWRIDVNRDCQVGAHGYCIALLYN